MNFEDIDKKYSKTFCIYPWIQQMVTQQGLFQLCCSANAEVLKKNESKDFYIQDDSFSDVWNSDEMKNIRKKMLNGEKVSSCEHCYYLESVNHKSWRQDANEGWFTWFNQNGELNSLIERSKNNDLHVDEAPTFLDLRLGTKCNLSCRMCHPNSSSLLYKEFAAINKKDPKFDPAFFIDETVKKNFEEPWVDNKRMWEDLESFVVTAKKIWISGGEPSVIPQNQRLINLIKEKNCAHNIEFMINTNVTKIKQEFVELIPSFKSVTVMLSIDGYGRTQEYIRYPSKWKDIDQNLKRYIQLLKENHSFYINLCTVIQLTNLIYLDELYDYFEDLLKDLTPRELERVRISPIPLYLPDYFKVEAAPLSIRTIAQERLESYMKRSQIVPKNDEFKHQLDVIIQQCRNTKNYIEGIDEYIRYNDKLDQHRKLRLKDYLPEFSSLIDSYRK